MNKVFSIISVLAMGVVLAGCDETPVTQDQKDAVMASLQQGQYAKSQPVPQYDWSLERHLIIELYNVRNMQAATHSVWRSNTGMIEGDCASIGFGMPYDTSLTNPLVATDVSKEGRKHTYQGGALASVEQAEPNGVFASKNTSATWVMCAGEIGDIEPVYVESKVTVYPYPVTVDYTKNRVTRAGSSQISISRK